MRKLSRLVVLALVLVAGTTSPLNAKMACDYGSGVYSPTTGEIADCLEGGGSDCYSCTVTPSK